MLSSYLGLWLSIVDFGVLEDLSPVWDVENFSETLEYIHEMRLWLL